MASLNKVPSREFDQKTGEYVVTAEDMAQIAAGTAYDYGDVMASVMLAEKLEATLKILRGAGYVVRSKQKNEFYAMAALGTVAERRNTAYAAVTYRSEDKAQLHFGPLEDKVQAGAALALARRTLLDLGLVLRGTPDKPEAGVQVSLPGPVDPWLTHKVD